MLRTARDPRVDGSFGKDRDERASMELSERGKLRYLGARRTRPGNDADRLGARRGVWLVDNCGLSIESRQCLRPQPDVIVQQPNGRYRQPHRARRYMEAEGPPPVRRTGSGEEVLVKAANPYGLVAMFGGIG